MAIHTQLPIYKVVYALLDTTADIPAGHVVRFLPGMHTTVEAEITPDRLECITFAENMRRNTVHRYPKEIKAAIRSIAVLNRRINHVSKHERSV